MSGLVVFVAVIFVSNSNGVNSNVLIFNRNVPDFLSFKLQRSKF